MEGTAFDGKARLYKSEADGALLPLPISATALNLSTSTWYPLKVVVDESGGSQRLRCWVDTLDPTSSRQGRADDDQSFADETTIGRLPNPHRVR